MKLYLFRQFFCAPPCIHFNQAETIYSPQSINNKLLVLGKTCAFYSKHGLTLKEKKFNISNFANWLVFKVGMFCWSCNLIWFWSWCDVLRFGHLVFVNLTMHLGQFSQFFQTVWQIFWRVTLIGTQGNAARYFCSIN